jgi:hypothetical protein
LNLLCYFFRPLIPHFIRFPTVVVDNNIWVTIIMALAGPMVLSGLYKAVLDWRVLTLLSNYQLPVEEVIELLVIVVSGNLLREAPAPNRNSSTQNPSNNAYPRYIDPKQGITDATMRRAGDERRPRLLGLMMS